MKLTKRHWIILGVVVTAAILAYLGYRWYMSRQTGEEGKNPEGLGSNLNSPAPELGAPGSAAAPTVGPAVEIPVTIDIRHSASEEPPASANPYRQMISSGDVKSPLAQGGGGHRPPARPAGFRLADRDDMKTDKDGASPYSTTMGPG